MECTAHERRSLHNGFSAVLPRPKIGPLPSQALSDYEVRILIPPTPVENRLLGRTSSLRKGEKKVNLHVQGSVPLEDRYSDLGK